MLVFLLVLSLLFITPAAFSQEIKPLYTLPEKKVTAREVSMESDAYLIGSDEGLFKVSSKSYAVPLWTDARVDQIIKIIPENNLLVIKGSVPGAKGSYIILEA